jgi:hypothetical protein
MHKVDGVGVEELGVGDELREVVGVRGLVVVDALGNAVGEEALGEPHPMSLAMTSVSLIDSARSRRQKKKKKEEGSELCAPTRSVFAVCREGMLYGRRAETGRL